MLVPTSGAYKIDSHDLRSPAFPLSEGPSTAMKDNLLNYLKNRTRDLNHSDPNAIYSASKDIDARVTQEMTNLRSQLRQASTVSALLHVMHNSTSTDSASWAGTRTNLDLARTPWVGLEDATVKLYAKLGKPLSTVERQALHQRALATPSEHSVAGALAIYAVLDAIGYLEQAYAGVPQEALEGALENNSALSLINRRLSVQQTDTGYEILFANNETSALGDVHSVVTGLDLLALYKAGDVLAAASNEILGRTFVNVPASLNSNTCGNGLYFYSGEDCMIVLGGTANHHYGKDGTWEWGYSKREKNIVLIDFGGNDIYNHRAGGGWSSGINDEAAGCEVGECYANVQFLMDLGSGSDKYLPIAPDAALIGSGVFGAGFLLDQGGDDDYIVTTARTAYPNAPVAAQGSAYSGIGILADLGGNDEYIAVQPSSATFAHAQAAALQEGVALLYDVSGDDAYTFTLQTSDSKYPSHGGGAQAFAAGGGTAFLVDLGTGSDTYTAGQDLVQAAANLGAAAILYDHGGTNKFEVVSSLGCNDADALDWLSPATGDIQCASTIAVPIGGWSQGYADTGAFAALLTGSGSDHFTIRLHGTGAPTEFEDRARLGYASTGALAILHDTGGNDRYTAARESLGFAYLAGAVFSDRGGDDAYECPSSLCHGRALSDGVGAFYDGVSSGDVFADGRDSSKTSVWAQNPPGVGLGAHVAPGTSSCSTVNCWVESPELDRSTYELSTAAT